MPKYVDTVPLPQKLSLDSVALPKCDGKTHAWEQESDSSKTCICGAAMQLTEAHGVRYIEIMEPIVAGVKRFEYYICYTCQKSPMSLCLDCQREVETTNRGQGSGRGLKGWNCKECCACAKEKSPIQAVLEYHDE